MVVLDAADICKTFGGTNWGNIGHSDGYTSYDYGAAITEERQVHREKYSEAKLIANFVTASGDALASATPGYNTTRVYADNEAVTVTPLIGEKTKFYVTRYVTRISSEAPKPMIGVAVSIIEQHTTPKHLSANLC